jgi:hypothetical protein
MAITSTPFKRFEKFDGNQRRSLRFNVNALADFEQETGMGVSQLMNTKAVWAATRALLWAGLKHEDNILTLDRTGELMGLFVQDGNNVNELLVEALAACQEQGAFGKPDAESAGKLRANRDRFVALASATLENEATSGAKPVLDVTPTEPSGVLG